MAQTQCYRCGAPAPTRDHARPKSFFPNGGNLQPKTVPSCPAHNNSKSGDDQYLLAHITISAAAADNLAKQIFMRSIGPHLRRAPKFAKGTARGSIRMDEGAVAYPVDVKRFDHFFDHLCYALYFDRYGARFDERNHLLTQHYLSLTTHDPDLRCGLPRLDWASAPCFPARAPLSHSRQTPATPYVLLLKPGMGSGFGVRSWIVIFA